MYNIEAGKIVWKDIMLMRLSEKEIEEYGLLPGDILVNRVNSRELVGKAAVFLMGLGLWCLRAKTFEWGLAGLRCPRIRFLLFTDASCTRSN